MRRVIVLAVALITACSGTEEDRIMPDGAVHDASGLVCGDYRIEWECVDGCVASTPFESHNMVSVTAGGVLFWRTTCGMLPVCNTLGGNWISDKVTGEALIEFEFGQVDVMIDDRYPIMGHLKYVNIYSGIRHELKFKGVTNAQPSLRSHEAVRKRSL